MGAWPSSFLAAWSEAEALLAVSKPGSLTRFGFALSVVLTFLPAEALAADCFGSPSHFGSHVDMILT